jgi:hypothetical protein
MNSTGKLVAVHQPNLLPWLGYFDKLVRSDVFVLLDNAQFPKKGGTWMNRVRMRVSGAAAWVTVPIDRSYHGYRTIDEIELGVSGWREKVLRTIRSSYAGAPHFDEVFPLVEEILGQQTSGLAEFNIRGVRILSRAIGLNDSRFVRASELGVTGQATDRLIALVRAVGGGRYLCGGGAGGYQDDAAFARAGLGLEYQDFRHPEYRQGDHEFIPGLSIVDALMWCGAAGTRALLGTEVQPSGPAASTSA